MGVYTRFKRSPEGLRTLVELLETTPIVRRQKMIDVGMEEDAEFTQKALQYMLTFKDIIGLPEMELAELVDEAPPRITGYAIHSVPKEVMERFLKCSKPPIAVEIRSFLEAKAEMAEIGGAQLKLVEIARKLEKKGLIRSKRIPI